MTTQLDAAAVLGVVVDEPYGDMSITGNWLRIGSIIVADDGLVHVVSRRCIGTGYMAELVGVAEKVAVSGRVNPEAWKYRDGLGWIAGVTVRLHRRSQLLAEEHQEERR